MGSVTREKREECTNYERTAAEDGDGPEDDLLRLVRLRAGMTARADGSD